MDAHERAPGKPETRAGRPTNETSFWHDWHHRAADPAAFLCLPPMIHLVAEKS